MRHISLVLLAACAVFLSGLQSMAADEDLSTIEGKVTYNGKPLQDGSITFHLKDDQFVGAKIQPDGTFRVERVPVGTVKVTFASKKLRIPTKYGIPETSPLTLEVKKGKGVADFQIRD
jgi:hypothetical protein